MNDTNYLSNINSPEDLKKLPEEALPALCEEIRAFLIDNISKSGGHLASNLGVVEITVGLHYVFDSPQDHIVFDVGHQSYTHKILTGRKDRFDSLRKKNGISGFMRPDESEHDPSVTGHASNSVSLALGFARADRLNGKKTKTACVIGDGALTGGLAYEALNDAGRSNLPLIIVVNDNEMSISKNVGGLANWFSKLRIKPAYFDLKAGTQAFLSRLGRFGRFLMNAISNPKAKFKTSVLPDNIFSVLGFEYLGPADGNDVGQVLSLLKEAKRLNKPVVVHFKTQK
ncbi:MAG: 1-deoxy-D-xylulose-5-phosphate synthase, partial [Clostridia bacterium]|nr:1-deoxy-D-xylulose-5-phosphate synthase [Clostridia bacterium]